MSYKIDGDKWIEHNVPFLKLLGMDCRVPVMGESETMLIQDDNKHMNDAGITHCGVPMSLLVTAMGVSAKTADKFQRDAVTVEMKTSFIQSAKGKLVAKATTLHNGGTLAFCEGRVYDSENNLCYTATGTFKYVRRP